MPHAEATTVTHGGSTSGSIVNGRTVVGDLDLACDVVVVGSGAGGAVIAALLAEAGQEVIVLEEGSHHPQASYGAMRPSETMRHLWREGGLSVAVGLGDSPVINLMMGECVGGSSVLTGGVCFRTPGHVLHEWSESLGLDELTEAGMDPFFREVEESVHVEEVPIEMRSESTRRFALGAERLGKPLKALRRNTRGCRGCGRCNFGCPHGAKLSVDLTYLPRALAAGARVYAECRVDRVLTHGARAAGVIGRVRNGPDRRPQGTLRVRARRVVMAAGGYCSPLLLERTGIGRQSGQLGRNLTVHPGFRVMARFDEKIEGWKGALQSAFSDAYESENITLVGLFVPPGVLAATMPGIGPRHAERAALVPHLAVFGGMIHDQAGGRIHHAFGQRLVTYRMSEADRATVPRLLRLMGETYFAAGAREVFFPVFGMAGCDADRFRTLDFERIPRRKLECTSQHPLGTARMGRSPEHAVVDPDGQTWELAELYVADGSIVPTSLGVNPQVTIMSMATRIAHKLRERPLPPHAPPH